MIELFEHNQIAYDALCTMLAETGKAAIIHPTGTGKSFIAFKLAEEYPHKQFCWLSPSEHIFQTQLENIRRISGFEPQNIRFLTYTRLMLMAQTDVLELKPDFIILDEFHRCGAEEWGKGVQKLLAAWPSAALVGLTATSIRYLDNQRDMANELFDGCVAHQMTLGEAIVRGCLPAPKYIVSYYSCQKDLERYVRRARRAGAAVQQAASKYLDKLRRMAEQADGLDRIFEKHMQEMDGKYIVFCSDHEHMQSILPHIGEWFAKVDEKPHVYQVYADSPTARQAFQAFKADHSSHLKLLLCIDMLNEGIHVEDLSGVMLFRPTVSPIIYKQQIGRALSAVKGCTPVIFDLVNNVDNLYSISAVRQEMEEIVRFFRNGSRDEQIVQDSFELIDEVREWRELFEQLEESLSAPWELMYQQAKGYYEANGHLNVPRRYKTEDELALGCWIHTQRNIRRGVCAGKLTEERIKLLDRIGMVWESVRDLAWEEGYEHALAYFHQHGNLDVPSRYASEDGYLLGSWITNMRSMYNGVRSRGSLSDERISQLESLGMIWNRLDFGFEQGYLAAARYAAQYGHLDVPVRYVDEDGFKLGRWLTLNRGRQETLSDEQKIRLEKLGFQWKTMYQQRWDVGYAEAKHFYEANGHLNVPQSYQRNGIKLARWLYHQQEQQAKRKLEPERRQLLDAIGMEWKKRDSWEENFLQAEAFYKAYGHLEVPAQLVTENGLWLNKWLSVQRKTHKEGALTPQQIQRLESIGMHWEPMKTLQWNRMYDALMQYCARGGSIAGMPQDCMAEHGGNLFNWVKKQKQRQKQGTLEPWQQAKLNKLMNSMPTAAVGD